MSLVIRFTLNEELKNQGSAGNIKVINFNNVTFTTSGKLGKCANFSSTSLCITANVPVIGNNFTVSWWLYQGTVSSTQMPWAIGYFNPLYNRCLNTGDGTSNKWLKPGTSTLIDIWTAGWHHFVVTGDGTTNKLYIDGVHTGNSTTFKGLTSTYFLMSGWQQYSTEYRFIGKLEDYRVYNECLKEEEIKLLANGEICHFPLTETKNNGCTITKFTGHSIIWNLLVNMTEGTCDATSITTGVSTGITYSCYNQKIALSGTLAARLYVYKHAVVNIIAGHTYLHLTRVTKLNGSTNVHIHDSGWKNTGLQNNLTQVGDIITTMVATESVNTLYIIDCSGNYTGETIDLEFYDMMFDLTRMFGAGNEPTADEFRTLFPNEYYSYDKGSFLNFGGRQYNWNQIINLTSGITTQGSDASTDWRCKLTVYQTAPNYIHAVADGTPVKRVWLNVISTGIIKGHTYYVKCDDFNTTFTTLGLVCGTIDSVYYNPESKYIRRIITSTGTYTSVAFINNVIPEQGQYVQGTIYVFDLTLMFGVGNEPTTPEQFESWLKLNNITNFSYTTGTKMNLRSNDVSYISKSKNLYKYCENKSGNINYYISMPSGLLNTLLSLTPGKTYTMSCNRTTQNASVTYWTINFTDGTYKRFFSTTVYNLDGSTRSTTTFTMGDYSSKTVSSAIMYTGTNSDGTKDDYFIKNIQIEEGNTATDYEPCYLKEFDISKFTENLPYGLCSTSEVSDTIEFNNNNIVITKKLKMIEMNSVAWRKLSTDNPHTYWISNSVLSDKKLAASIYSTKYTYSGHGIINDTSDDKIIVDTNSGNLGIRIHDTDYNNNADAFRNSLAGEYILYELATPVTYTIPLIDTTITNGTLEGELKGFSASEIVEYTNGSKNVIEYDITGHKNNGISTGFITAKTNDITRYNKHLQFTTGNYITAIIPSSNIITCSFWGKKESSRGKFLRLLNGPSIIQRIYHLESDNRYIEYACSNTNGYSAFNLDANMVDKWNHYCILRNGDTGAELIYVNGVLKATYTNTTGNVDRIIFGPSESNVIDDITDVRAFATLLTEEEIIKLYNLGKI